MDYFAGLDISMDAAEDEKPHGCVSSRYCVSMTDSSMM
jgi:hypothetical protein